jgi:hypothetical protein
MLISSRCLARRLVFRPRRQNYSVAPTLSAVNEHDLARFSKILPPSSILSTLPPLSLHPSELAPYNTDWLGKYTGRATTVLKPSTTQQVSDIMKHCWERRIGVVPQGGNTGLVGGSVPVNDELVLNLGNMSNVRAFDPLSGVVDLSIYLYLLSRLTTVYIVRHLGGGCRLHSPVSNGLYRASFPHHAFGSRCKGEVCPHAVSSSCFLTPPPDDNMLVVRSVEISPRTRVVSVSYVTARFTARSSASR